jgi:hypothetical protein
MQKPVRFKVFPAKRFRGICLQIPHPNKEHTQMCLYE